MASRFISLYIIYDAYLTTHNGDAQQKANFKSERQLKCSVLLMVFNSSDSQSNTVK